MKELFCVTYLFAVVYSLFFTWFKMRLNPKRSEKIIEQLTDDNFIDENDFRIAIIITCILPIINIWVIERHTVVSIKKLLK